MAASLCMSTGEDSIVMRSGWFFKKNQIKAWFQNLSVSNMVGRGAPFRVRSQERAMFSAAQAYAVAAW